VCKAAKINKLRGRQVKTANDHLSSKIPLRLSMRFEAALKWYKEWLVDQSLSLSEQFTRFMNSPKSQKEQIKGIHEQFQSNIDFFQASLQNLKSVKPNIHSLPKHLDGLSQISDFANSWTILQKCQMILKEALSISPRYDPKRRVSFSHQLESVKSFDKNQPPE